MNQNMSSYRYFAFISYNRKDKEWATWLQKRLEKYRLPSQIRKDHRHLPARITPIFRDETDLSGTILEDALVRELQDSQYLIVVCSPNSTASEYVNLEIETFKSLGRQDRIIPFIVDGVPFSDDPATECFPAAIRSVTPELLGISVNELGRYGAFLRVVSTLLQLRYDEVVMRDRKRQLRNRILAGIGAAALVAAIGAGVWYNTPHSKYYNSYICQNEIPQGLYELSESQVAITNNCYRITTLRGHVIRLENINSQGTVCDPTFTTPFTDYPILEYQYDDDGELISILQKDADGILVFQKNLSVNKATNEIAIDFHSPGNQLDAQALSSNMISHVVGDSSVSTKSEITRLRNTYNEEGYLITTRYQRDNLGTPACDANGVYGKQYEYNDLGQVIRISNLDEHGNLYNCRYGWASEEHSYDSYGNEILSQMFDANGKPASDKDGYFATQATFDEAGNPIRLQYLGEHGEPVNNYQGVSTILSTFDSQGFLTSQAFYSADGNPVYDWDDIHKWTCQYDAKGNPVRYSFFDAYDQPLYSASLSAASVEYRYDKADRLSEIWKYDTTGALTCDTTTGAYGIRYLYNKNGYECGIEYLDQDGQLTMSKFGYAASYGTLDDAGRTVRYEYRDEQNQLTRSSENYAIAQQTYDTFGNLVHVQVLDENQEPCYTTLGFSSQEYTFEDGKLTTVASFDADGDPMINSDFYHKEYTEYDDRGNALRTYFYDVDGQLMELPDAYAVDEREYDAYGNILVLRYYTAEMQPAALTDIYQYTWTYDQRGNRIREDILTEQSLPYKTIRYEYDDYDHCILIEYLDKNGQLVNYINHGARILSEYDGKGNRVRQQWFDANGLPLNAGSTSWSNVKESLYDDYNRLVLERYLNADANDNQTCLWQMVYTYDSYGNVICEERLDGNDAPFLYEEGYYRIIKDYYPSGNVRSEEHFGAQGEPVLYDGTAFRYEYDYDASGNVTELRMFDTKRQPIKEADGIPACYRYEYDARGSRTWRLLFDENGNSFHIGDIAVKGEQFYYDDMGYEIGGTYYDVDGNILVDNRTYVYVSQVWEGSLGEAAGLHDTTFLIEVGDWNYFDQTSTSNLHNLTAEFSRVVYKEKTVVLCEMPQTGVFLFHRYQLPEGVMGIRVESDETDSTLLDQMHAAYLQWLQENP